MTRLQITVVAMGAMLVFWAVGAYNRLMRLRSAIPRKFAALDEQFTLRHTLMQDLLDTLAPALAMSPEEAQTLATLKDAATQAQAARAHAKAHPGAAGAMQSLRLAENSLLQAHGRLASGTGAGAELAAGTALSGQIAALEPALRFAQSRFNDAVMEYNHAVHQFPTSLLAGLFGFRAAGAL